MFALLGILFISLTSQTCNTPEPSTYEPPTEEAEIKFRRITKDGFSLEVPRFMNQTKKLDQQAVLQAENGVRQAYLVIREVPLSELASTPTANQRIRQPNSLSLPAFRDRFLTSLGFEVFTSQWKELSDLDIPAVEAQVVELSGKRTPQEEETTHLIGFVKGPEHVFAIMAWTEASQIEAYRPIFEKMLQSFRLEERWEASFPSEKEERFSSVEG
ncbi:MAG: hypothetical protein AAF399_19365 [Bacteroidota bacterium]